MAWFFLGTLPFYFVGVGIGLWDWLKRDGATSFEHDLLIAYNTTGFSGRDIHRLRNLRMNVIHGTDSAVFSTEDFEVTGAATGFRERAVDGFQTGGLSFRVPGIDRPVEGMWLTISDTMEDEKNNETKELFHEYHRWLKDKPALVDPEWLKEHPEELFF